MHKLLQALIKARSEFPTIKKDAQGQLGNRKYSYATLDAVIDATFPTLARYRLCIVNTMEFDGTNRVLVCTLYHESGYSIQSRYTLPPCMDSRELGSAITYGRRYLLTALLNLNLEEDLDGATHRTETAKFTPKRRSDNSSQLPQKQPEYTKQDWIKAIDAILTHKKIPTETARSVLKDLFNVRSRSLLNIEQLSQFFEYLKSAKIPNVQSNYKAFATVT